MDDKIKEIDDKIAWYKKRLARFEGKWDPSRVSFEKGSIFGLMVARDILRGAHATMDTVQ